VEYTQILYEPVGRVARVTLNRPEYRNPIGRITIEELDDAFTRAVRDDEIRVILLRAEGPHFSAGHDLGTPAKLRDDAARPYPEGVRGVFHRSWELYIDPGLKWRNLPKPTVCAVQGKCIWGGWMVATTMDIIFASEDAHFLGSKFQYFSVPWDIGIRKAKEVLFEPRFINAYEALEYGFVNRVLPREELDAEALAYAERIAENDSWQLRLTKLAINQAQDMQGYTNHIIAAHSTPNDGRASQGRQLPSGQRQIAPIARAMRNLELVRGVWGVARDAGAQLTKVLRG
jgi:enoyl-CoA hydratase